MLASFSERDQTAGAARLYRIGRYDGLATLWIANSLGDTALQVVISARFSPSEVKRFVAQGAQALVVRLDDTAPSQPFGVAIDFVLAAAPRGSRQVLCVDEISLGDGQARIFWAQDALHIAATNIDSQARYSHRICGGSIKIG